MTAPVQCEPMPAIDEDGWCEWIHPLPGYLMQCCDCGLIHEMEYAIAPRHENCGDGELNEGETSDGVIIFRAHRHSSSGQSLREAAQAVVSSADDYYTARNGRRMSIEGEDGEKCWIVQFDQFEHLRAMLGGGT